jgi:ankyrin repeat protein
MEGKMQKMFTKEEKIEFLACDTFEKFEAFINNYDEINKFDEFGNTILHYFIKNIKSFKLDPAKVIEKMIDNGINLNAQTKNGKFNHTPLNLAMFSDSTDIFDLLIEKGADINITVGNGNSLISNALVSNNPISEYFIKKLIENGADVYVKNNNGISAIGLVNTIENRVDYKKYFSQYEYKEGD